MCFAHQSHTPYAMILIELSTCFLGSVQLPLSMLGGVAYSAVFRLETDLHGDPQLGKGHRVQFAGRHVAIPLRQGETREVRSISQNCEQPPAASDVDAQASGSANRQQLCIFVWMTPVPFAASRRNDTNLMKSSKYSPTSRDMELNQ